MISRSPDHVTHPTRRFCNNLLRQPRHRTPETPGIKPGGRPSECPQDFAFGSPRDPVEQGVATLAMSVAPAWVGDMAALPLEHPGPDTPAEVLAALESTHTVLADAEIGQFALAVEWAIAHPITSVADIATVEGTEGQLAIAGAGAPLVAEFCVADFAAAIGVSTDAGRGYLGDAVEAPQV